MNNKYNSFNEIEQDLRKLNLKRQICLEEMRLIKSEFKEEIQPYHWISTIFSGLKKYGTLYLIKKIFK